MDLKKISELFAVVVPPLILCACIRLVVYYKNWDIPIIDYLSPTELLFSFIQPALVFIALAAIYFAIVLILTAIPLGIAMYKHKKNNKEEKPEKSSNEQTNIIKAKKNNVGGQRFGSILKIIIRIFSYAVGLIIFFGEIWENYSIIATLIFHVTLLLVINWILKWIRGTNGQSSSYQWTVIAILITLISASFFYARFEIHETATHPKFYKFTLSDSTIIRTNNKVIYLGKTNDYYFLFDSTHLQSIIIPTKQVNSINIKKSKN